jgi:SpoIID/LytB domain protein
MKSTKLRKTTIVLTVLFTIFCVLNAPFSVIVNARTIDEINADIKKSQDELNNLKAQMDQANKDLTATQSQKNSSSSEINKVKSQLAEVQNQYNVNVLKKQELENEIQLKELEKEQKQTQQDSQIVSTYISWKTDDATSTILQPGDVLKNIIYYEYLTEQTQQGIKDLAGQIDGLNTQSDEYQKQANDLQNDIVSLVSQKALLEDQIKKYDQAITDANKTMADMKARSTKVQSDQNDLFAELETEVTNNLSGTSPLVSGEMYFLGTVGKPGNNKNDPPYCSSGIDPATDAFGHGIGMSQFGAYGAAANGWNASRILSFYYQGATVTHLDRTAPVSVTHGGQTLTMSMDDYVSGLGEVPNLACGTLDQINSWNNYANQQSWAPDDPRRNKYVIDNPNSIYDCWPEEAIKAQVIIARSYAATSSMPICDSASCQVYNGGKGKAWAAYETSNQYLTVNGNPIRAYYSAFNSNSHGTADIDSVWNDWKGNGSSLSYFRSVNDSAFAYIPTLCGTRINWINWRSNSYTIPELDSMLTWCGQQGHCNSWSNIKSIKNTIGTLKSISLTRDASGRVKKVNFVGSNGSASISGWYMRQVFNTWASAVKPKGLDKLQSITFNIAVAQ